MVLYCANSGTAVSIKETASARIWLSSLWLIKANTSVKRYTHHWYCGIVIGRKKHMHFALVTVVNGKTHV